MSATTQPKPSYAQRRIDVAFSKVNGVFAASGTNAVTLSGLRVSARVSQQGGAYGQGTLSLHVWGMTREMMNDLSVVPRAPLVQPEGHAVALMAGDLGSTLALAYRGNITGAVVDYDSAPDVGFMVNAITGYDAALNAVLPSSYRGAADAAVVLADMAARFSIRFENSGVTGVVLNNPYYTGSPRDQIAAAATEAGIGWVLDQSAGGDLLAIWPRGGTRGGLTPLISPGSGLVGYPVRTLIGVDFTMLYNPSIRFGAKVQIDSDVPTARGIWQVMSVDHELDAQLPHGAWFTRVSTVGLGTI